MLFVEININMAAAALEILGARVLHGGFTHVSIAIFANFDSLYVFNW